MVADDAVGGAIFGHVVWDVTHAAVDEAGDKVTITIQFGNWVEGVLVEPALDEGAVNLFADTTLLTIHQILDLCPVGEGDGHEVAENVVIVGGSFAAIDLFIVRR